MLRLRRCQVLLTSNCGLRGVKTISERHPQFLLPSTQRGAHIMSLLELFLGSGQYNLQSKLYKRQLVYQRPQIDKAILRKTEVEE